MARPRSTEATQPTPKLRTAIVHHWFVRAGGGERVVAAIGEIFPEATVFSPIVRKEGIPDGLQHHRIVPLALSRLPGAARLHRILLPAYPLILEQLDLREYELVISSESGPAKGVLTNARTCHICYCHTPMRYIWDMYQDYKQNIPGGPVGRSAFRFAAHYMRMWDRASADRVDYFVASSANGAARIRKCYRRDAQIVYPPVDTSAYSLSSDHDDHFLAIGRLVKYKRFDLAILACNELKRELLIVGEGEEYRALKRLAGPTVKFLGTVTDSEVKKLYTRCKALLFPGEEDIGLTPIEAQASGRPVIALARGGALETVNAATPHTNPPPDATGVFFREPTVQSLSDAIKWLEKIEPLLSPPAARKNAQRFDTAAFRIQFLACVNRCIEDFNRQQKAPLPPN